MLSIMPIAWEVLVGLPNMQTFTSSRTRVILVLTIQHRVVPVSPIVIQCSATDTDTSSCSVFETPIYLALQTVSNWCILKSALTTVRSVACKKCAASNLLSGRSPWCELLDHKHWVNFEYAWDVIHYYRTGPKESYAPTTSWL